MTSSSEIDALFLALSDQTRRAILIRLAEGDASVNDLCEPFDLKRPTISQHLKVLEQAGLVSTKRQAQFRTKSLKPQNLRIAAEWISRCANAWEQNFDRLEEYIDDLERKDRTDEP
ncbi:ArsR/SmtB family transcription factor [Anianabacter salinae]|uniref:ArsR/SmtB family transcription factor n=1 Tax=Anianabacter salinae TaxID=2851023 RepID=UPI00225DCE3C|nr:metalloregulator ArsR/SmtB family transcription factor [Anianabacter salinae]MBV0912192.1 metalloregulator ArsR/SmtB family transcription factor [Anianabacter salinae]